MIRKATVSLRPPYDESEAYRIAERDLGGKPAHDPIYFLRHDAGIDIGEHFLLIPKNAGILFILQHIIHASRQKGLPFEIDALPREICHDILDEFPARVLSEDTTHNLGFILFDDDFFIDGAVSVRHTPARKVAFEPALPHSPPYLLRKLRRVIKR